MKSTDSFKLTIKAYLDNRAQTDSLFATAYAKENKNIDECCNYILSEVQKSGCNGFADEEIFSMAVHYYDEDDLKNIKPINCKVVVNHSVELTEDEIKQAQQEARQKAIDKVMAEEQARLSKKSEKVKKEKVVASVQPSLFD